MKIGLVYGHVASNLGDLCINLGVVNILNQLYPNGNLHVVFRNPNDTYLEDAKKTFEQYKNVEFFYFNTPKRVDENIPLLKRYIDKPESFLLDTGLYDCDIILNNSGEFLFSYHDDPRLDLLWRLIPALASKSKNIKFVTLPSTVGPFEAKEGANVIRSFFTLNDAYAVRDMKSMSLVSELMKDDPTPPLLLDPAFFINYKTTLSIDKVVPPRLGVIMRLDEFGLRLGGERSSKNYRNLKKRNFEDSASFKITYNIVKEFFDKVDGTVYLFVQTRYDYELAQRIREIITEEGSSSGSVNLIQPSSIEEYIAFLSKTNIVISSRFHGCILSLLAGVAPIGFYFDSHGHKLPGLYEMLGIADYCFRVNKESIKGISDEFISIYNRRFSILKSAKKSIGQSKEKTLSWFEEKFKNKVIEADYNQQKIYYKEYLDSIKSTYYEHKLNQLIEENNNIKNTIQQYESLNNELLSQIDEIKSQLSGLYKVIDELQAGHETINEKLHHFKLIDEKTENMELKQKYYENIIYTITNNLIPTEVSPYNRNIIFKNKVKQQINNFFGLKPTYNKIMTFNFKLQTKEVKISFSSNKLEYVDWQIDKVYYSLPNNEAAYLTSKDKFNFDLPPNHEYFKLEPNTIYEISGQMLFKGLKITLWLIEYDNKKRIKDCKLNLTPGAFNFNLKTDVNHKNLVIALRLSGEGYIQPSEHDWQIRKK